VTDDRAFVRNPDVSWRTIEGQSVLVLNREGEVHVLNEVGTYVWEHLELPPEELARNIAAAYEVGLDQAREDVRDFIEELREAGALVEKR
jgi:hypothetical protein